MSSIEEKAIKSIESNLENELETIEFGEPELNKIFKELGSETKNKILKIPNKEQQITVLKSLADPELMALWDSFSEKQKAKLDSISIRDKIIYLKQLNEKKKKEKEDLKKSPSESEQKSVIKQFSPKSPEDNPPTPTPTPPSPKLEAVVPKEAPADLFREEAPYEKPADKKHAEPNQKRLNDLINIFYSKNPFYITKTKLHELEVRFGTKGIKPLTRNDYDNVIKKLKSFGFTTTDSSGMYSLRVNCEFLDSRTGKYKVSDIRTEISGIHTIQDYCKTNDLKTIYNENPTAVNFTNKRMAGEMDSKNVLKRYYPVDFDDFNFRVSYNTEESISMGLQGFILENWRKSKKEFRYLNRVSFQHPDYPFIIDISIVKYGNRAADKYGRENRGPITRVYSIDDSNVFNNQEIYEIEIEIDNHKIGPATKFNSPDLIAQSLRKVIKYILGGLQGTNYPISYPEQQSVLESYMRLLWKDEFDRTKRINSQYFIGPNSITLQLSNIAPLDENSNEPNIRKEFVVTDKADGERHLMYISDEGKIYLINTNMDVIFTGAKTHNKECFNTLLDGELIAHDKNGKFINLYAAFDVYYIKKQDVRQYTFLLLESEEDMYKSRYQLLKFVHHNLNPVSIMDMAKPTEKTLTLKSMTERYKVIDDLISPIRFVAKEFFPNSNSQTIFEGCNMILQKEREQRFEYITDGLIFSHAFNGVGSNTIGKAGPKTKITWEYSFKWKPPQYNTIDFLITTVKGPNGDDVIKSMFEDGINNESAVQYSQYKMIELRCGFSEKRDGFINPCQDVIDDNLPQFSQRFEDRQDNDYVPKRFYPTEPYDSNAGLCNIMLRMDGSGGTQMFSEDNEVFEDNTIVEFRYDLSLEEGWRWIPLRVRYDKTAKLRRGEREYGNSYKVCNENWKSIHPSGRIDENMLYTGLNIPSVSVSEDVYYNSSAGKFKTNAMKNFHNLYVKKKLIV